MQFFRFGQLKQKLRDRTMSDLDALPYLIAYVAITSMVCLMPMETIDGFWQWGEAISSVLLCIASVCYAYIKNGGKNGFDLILKYVVIGWIVSNRCFIVLAPLMIIFVLMSSSLMLDDATFDIVTFVVTSLFGLAITYGIGKNISETT